MPTWSISAFEKRLHETETSLNVVNSVKRSGVHFSIIIWSLIICQITHSLIIQKIKNPSITTFQLQIIIETDARPFDTIHDILQCLSLVQSFLKGRNAPTSGTISYETVGNRRVKKNWLITTSVKEYEPACLMLGDHVSQELCPFVKTSAYTVFSTNKQRFDYIIFCWKIKYVW